MIKDTFQIRDRYATGATWLKSRYSEAVTEFDTWLEEHDRQVAERAWDEAAEIDAGCHDCIDLNGYTNPYRNANADKG